MSRCVRGLETGWRVCPPRGYSAHTGRAPRRHKNGEYAAVTCGRPAFQRYEAHAEGSDTTPPHRSTEKMQNGSFYHLPQQGSHRNPAKRFRWEEDERQRARVLPLAAGRGIRRPLGRRPASHLSGLRRSRCPAKCTERAKPCTQIPGRSPDPLKAASVSAETLLPASGGAASKGDQSPFEEPPALRGDERNHFRKVIQHEKRYQVQHAHGVR